MNLKSKTVLFGLALVLALALPAAYAQQPGGNTPPADRSNSTAVSGKITSVTPSSFSIEVKRAQPGEDKEKSDQVETLTFAIDSSTKVDGKLEVGSIATVDYTTKEGKNLATRVRVETRS